MKICRYKGPNREALYKTIHQEMGPNAVVVTPESSGGMFGRNKQYELIAILDDSKGAADPAAPAPEAKRTGPSAEEEEIRRLRRQQSRQWRDMQVALDNIKDTIQTLKVTKESPAAAAEVTAQELPVHAQHWDPRFCAWARSACPVLLQDDPVQAHAALGDLLKVEEQFPFQHAERRPHIIVLVGPTGSGKTTTLAKLAAITSMQRKLKIGLITADTFRVAAVDQIREYASLLDAELRVIFSAEEARSAVAAMSDYDVILVDTPGRAHFDEVGLATVHKVLQGMGAVTVLLTVPATLNRPDLPDMIDGFSRFKPDYLVVTKVDETRHPTIFTSLPFESDLRVAFVTDGQRVPQDIFAARSARIADLLIKPETRQEAPVLEGATA
jgi:flagellar biosynthesis GTPase FlhF